MSNLSRNIVLKVRHNLLGGIYGTLTYRRVMTRTREVRERLNHERHRACSSTSYSSAADSIPKGDEEEDVIPKPVTSSRFVPKCEPVRDEDVQRLQEFVNHSKRLMLMTGE